MSDITYSEDDFQAAFEMVGLSDDLVTYASEAVSALYEEGPTPLIDNYGSEGRSATDRQSTPIDGGTSSSMLDAGMGLVKNVGSWMETNKELTKVLATGIGSAIASKNSKEAARLTAQDRKDEMRLASQIKQEEADKKSANILGMRPIGIIGAQRQLTRTNGSNVFDNGKYIKA